MHPFGSRSNVNMPQHVPCTLVCACGLWFLWLASAAICWCRVHRWSRCIRLHYYAVQLVWACLQLAGLLQGFQWWWSTMPTSGVGNCYDSDVERDLSLGPVASDRRCFAASNETVGTPQCFCVLGFHCTRYVLQHDNTFS